MASVSRAPKGSRHADRQRGAWLDAGFTGLQPSSAQFVRRPVGGGVRSHPENARMSGRHGVQYVAQCVACAALTLVVWQ